LRCYPLEKIKEAKKELFHEKDETRVIVNPEDGYIIGGEDFAVVLSRIMPQRPKIQV